MLNNTLKSKLKNIKCIFLDFDGVFTDNHVYVNEDGTESVRCNRSDGIGIELLKKKKFLIYIISSEKNKVVSERAKKLKINCFRNVTDKGKKISELLKRNKLKKEDSLFLGNDINDLEAFKEVNIKVAVNDCHPSLDKIVNFKTKKNGGNGAVRELCDIMYSIKK
tara:strand:- start:10379 stop:10873 length:495 start_codon:yes stop_codon:yes gene_type:complete